MKIEFAIEKDLEQISRLDEYITKTELARLIPLKRVIVARENEELHGWLRFGLFWDSIPFMNMLFVLQDFQGKGLGRRLVEYWETDMKAQGYKRLMTSTLSNEEAQHFYRKLGYRDCGSLLLPDEPLEIMFIKELCQSEVKKKC